MRRTDVINKSLSLCVFRKCPKNNRGRRQKQNLGHFSSDTNSRMVQPRRPRFFLISFFLRRGKTIFLTVDVNGIHFVSLSPGKPLKKKNENIYLRGLIFPPAMFFFFFFFYGRKIFCASIFRDGEFSFKQKKKKTEQGAESSEPAVTFHRYHVCCLNDFKLLRQRFC